MGNESVVPNVSNSSNSVSSSNSGKRRVKKTVIHITSDDIFTTHNKTVDENDDTEHTSRTTHTSKTTTCKKFFHANILSLKVSEQETSSK